ncbi:MAG: transposase [Oscillospiraceae bacterium]|nr:transposase [Oscillospiraceae bacterium]
MEEQKTTRYTVLKLRLHPTLEQAALIEKTFGCCRYLWNRMLADVREFYAATDLQYIPTPAHYKKEAPFLREVDSQALCAAHQSLRRAYLDYFRDPADFRRPKFRRKKSGRDSFTTPCRQLPSGPTVYLTDEGVRLPKLGVVRAVFHRRPLHGWSLRSAAVSKTRSGKYFIALTFSYEAKVPQRPAPTAENTLGLLTPPGLPPGTEQYREKLVRMQKKLSRMQRGSRNYEKQLRKLRLLHEHAANRRRDFIHKESRRIANAWEAVCVGAAAPGSGLFRECLRYKLEQQGKRLLLAHGPARTAEELRDLGLAQAA